MKYIKLLQNTLLGLLLVSLTACGVVSFKPAESETSTVAAEAGPIELVMPDPYLKTRTSVPDEALAYFKQANQAMAEKNWVQAEEKLLWLNEHYPDLSGPYLNLALCYQYMEQPKKAEAAFKKVLEANPDNSQAYNQFAIFLRGQGEFTRAESLYLKGLAVWPDNPETHLNLGILYDMYMGKFEQALQHYQRYQALLPEPERKVSGWIIDIQRRLKTVASGEQ
jgi:tetratricopeptide (TPR) repeat protein